VPETPAAWRRLVDDAAIFPPGDAPPPAAVTDHRKHREAAYADVVGPFVVDDLRLPVLIDVLRAAAPLAVTVVVKGGVGAVASAVDVARSSPALDLRSIEVAARQDDDIAAQVHRLDTAVPTFVEVPILPEGPTPSWLAGLDQIATAGHRLKLRTGGLTPEAFPDARALAASIAGALEREVAFKCTAGLHHALRHREEATGLERHGFLNVLVATAAAGDGAEAGDLAALLDTRDAPTLLGAAGTREWEAARRWFTSFGCCDVLDPIRDLVALDLLDHFLLEHA
jgi:hypothetical protein